MDKIKENNTHIEIYSVFDEEFLKYGKVIEGINFTSFVTYLEEKTHIPEQGNIYVASDREMEEMSLAKVVQETLYGGMDIEIGYCNGNNSFMNAQEYHKCSEINVGATDIVLLLSQVTDIKDGKLNTRAVKGFYVPKGVAVEIFATTMHFAPCKLSDEGFKCLVILTKGTNEPIDFEKGSYTQEDRLLFMKNKWLIAHRDSIPAKEKGAYAGIEGENIRVNY
ncbi:MAG: hypothetical protein K0S71_2848 [Clostridia bacterium]|jgi:hypothetical protein|nr:hypothetical protein [Clostridia bacterium]